MTDNEIIKALEYCTSGGNCYKCDEDDKNPQLSKEGCMALQMQNALALINRQKEELERLEREIEDLESTQEISPEAKYLVDTKADRVISLMNELIKSQEQIKAEAVKEFAEMVKEKIRTMSRIVVYDEDIDNLVKEFTEEQK